MKWMKRSVILVLAILAGILFALESGKVPQLSWDAYAIDGKGQLSLLREDGKMWRVSSSGELLGEYQLPQQDEEGRFIRYGDMVADDSGTLYLAREHYEVLVDGEGKRQEVISLEEVVSWGSDGTIQAAVVTVDKTALSGLSTHSYFRKLQMQGDTLLAICEDQGRYDILKVQPYGDASPETLSSFFLETTEEGDEEQALVPEDFAALWACKESIGKESGYGLPYPPSRLAVPLPGESTAFSSQKVYALDGRFLRTYAGPGWQGAVCAWERPPEEIIWLELQ